MYLVEKLGVRCSLWSVTSGLKQSKVEPFHDHHCSCPSCWTELQSTKEAGTAVYFLKSTGRPYICVSSFNFLMSFYQIYTVFSWILHWIFRKQRFSSTEYNCPLSFSFLDREHWSCHWPVFLNGSTVGILQSLNVSSPSLPPFPRSKTTRRCPFTLRTKCKKQPSATSHLWKPECLIQCSWRRSSRPVWPTDGEHDQPRSLG